VSNIISDKSGDVIDFHLYGSGSSVGKLNGVKADVVKYRTVTLTKVLEYLQAPQVIDFLSLDVEGAELAVLKGLDFNKYQMHVIIVERPEEAVHLLLVHAGYYFVRKISHGDCAYFHRELPNFDMHMRTHASGEKVRWQDADRNYLLKNQWTGGASSDGQEGQTQSKCEKMRGRVNSKCGTSTKSVNELLFCKNLKQKLQKKCPELSVH